MRNENVDIDILVTSRNGCRENMQSLKNKEVEIVESV